MLESRSLIKQTIEMYDEIKNFRDNISKISQVMDSNEILTAKSASKINDIFVDFWLCMTHSAKGEEYFIRICGAIFEEKGKLVIKEILAELDEALKLFNAEEIERLRNQN